MVRAPEASSKLTGRRTRNTDVASQRRVSVSDPHSARLKAVEKRLAALERELDKLRNGTAAPETIILRSISREEATTEIRKLFETGKTHYYSDIEKELRIDYELVVEICNELMEAGEIMVNADDAVRSR